MKSYGTATLRNGLWIIRCEPHVAVRLKRTFGNLARGKQATIVLSASEENSRDLEWFCARYPLEISDPETLTRLARTYDRRREVVTQILGGSAVYADLPMALPPREYQRLAAELVRTTGGLLLADEVGLGKTVVAIATMAHPGLRPALCVVPTHLQRQWKAEIERFLPLSYVHIAKKTTPYNTSHRGRAPDVLIVNYHKLHGWAEHAAGQVNSVIFDEVHELRRRKDGHEITRRWAAAQTVAMRARVRCGLSATPIYNYGEEFWNVLEILRPGALGTHEEFLTEWCLAGEKHPIRDPKAFGSYLRDHALMLRRTRKEVGRELPSLSTIIEPVESGAVDLASDTTELARLILGEGRGFDKMQAASQFDMRLRQATGLAKAPYVAAFVRMLLEQGPVVLFGWHRLVYDAWAKAFEDLKPAWYTGTESPSKKAEELARFKRGDTPLFIMSLRAGAGVDGLQHVASQVVIGELDWSPGALTQCVGRLHRDGQPNPVMAYYLISDQGADPTMVDVLDLKRQQLEGAIEPDGALSQAVSVDPHHVRKLAEAYLGRMQARRP